VCLISALLPTGASAEVSQEELDALRAKRQTIQAERQKKQAEIDELTENAVGILVQKRALDERNMFTMQQIQLNNEEIALYDQMIADKEREVLNAQELETFASAKVNDKQLVAVLNRGSLVKEDARVATADFNGIYVEKAEQFGPKVQTNNVVRNNDIALRGFTRKAVSYSVKTPGKTVVTIMNADGEQVARLVNDGALAGINTVAWDASNIPSGRYMVSIDHNGSVSGKFAILK
jgi:hypothetical protein